MVVLAKIGGLTPPALVLANVIQSERVVVQALGGIGGVTPDGAKRYGMEDASSPQPIPQGRPSSRGAMLYNT